MAQKSTLGKVNQMGAGAVRYALKKAEENGNIASKYYQSLLDRINELSARR
jgi:hypothetical protein